MSEAMTIPPLGEAPAKRTPIVYFIDDSATMREVIKIAFRRENINVITCADAASALSQFDQNRPDVVITDVIMPDQDGYSVCSQIKQHPDFSETPVVLMSGVVNKSVADKAVAVKADELIRKPFQPQQVAPPPPATTESALPSALAEAFVPRQPSQPQHEQQQSTSAPVRPALTAADVQKLRVEIAHLDLLVKKLQTELQIERQYNQALVSQIRTPT